jgi:hypothetical protein
MNTKFITHNQITEFLISWLIAEVGMLISHVESLLMLKC